MAQKMPRRLVAMSASAIAAIYFAGYLATRGADAGLAGPEAAPAAAVATVPGAPSSAAPLTVQQPASVAPTTASSTAVTYRDGTYQGRGTSRRGDVGVSVTIQGGRITNVAITQITTQYPASRIAALPGQVVARQSAQVDRITGATYSVQAFQQAVQQALAQARTSGTSVGV